MAITSLVALLVINILISGYAITSPLGSSVNLDYSGHLSLPGGTYVLVYSDTPVSSFEADPGYYAYRVIEPGNNTGIVVMCNSVECPEPRLVLLNSTIEGEYFFELDFSVSGGCPYLESIRLGDTVLDASFVETGLITLRINSTNHTCKVELESTHLTVSRDSWLSIKFNVSKGSLIIIFGPLGIPGNPTESPAIGDREGESLTATQTNEVGGLPEPHTPEVDVNIKGEKSLLRMLPGIALVASIASLALAVVSEFVSRNY